MSVTERIRHVAGPTYPAEDWIVLYLRSNPYLDEDAVFDYLCARKPFVCSYFETFDISSLSFVEALRHCFGGRLLYRLKNHSNANFIIYAWAVLYGKTNGHPERTHFKSRILALEWADIFVLAKFTLGLYDADLIMLSQLSPLPLSFLKAVQDDIRTKGIPSHRLMLPPPPPPNIERAACVLM
jgi:hypothetical protein